MAKAMQSKRSTKRKGKQEIEEEETDEEDNIEIEEEEEEEEEEEREERKRPREPEDDSKEKSKAQKSSEEDSAPENDKEKNEKALALLAETAQDNWMSLASSIGDGSWANQLFTSIPTRYIFIQQNANYLNVRRWIDDNMKKSYGVCKWTPPLYVCMAFTAGDGNYNPANENSDTYEKARLVIMVSDEMTPDLEADLDADDPPDAETHTHVLWKNAVTGFFEDMIQKQNRLLSLMWDCDTFRTKRESYISTQKKIMESQLKTNKHMKHIKPGSEEYNNMINEAAKAAFIEGARKPVVKTEDGKYILSARRRLFKEMPDEKKKQWEVIIDQAKAQGKKMDDISPEYKPLLQFQERYPLQVADSNMNMLPAFKDYTKAHVTRGSYVMLKLNVIVYLRGDNYGVSTLLSRWDNQPEVILYRKGDPALAGATEAPQFKGAQAITLDHETTNESHNSDALLKKFKWLTGSSVPQIEG